jgi:glycine/D-amino acid oxidase-like deaminating enzyme
VPKPEVSNIPLSDPRMVCKYLFEECERRGVRFLFRSSATKVHTEPDTGLTHVDVQPDGQQPPLRLPCRNLVISAGSWSGKVLALLFPDSTIPEPMSKKQSAQTWLRLAGPGKRGNGHVADRVISEQVWLAPAIDGDLHISQPTVDEFYVAGAIKESDQVPRLPDEVCPSQEEVDAMASLASKYI